MFIQNAAANENMIRAVEDGAVTLYYDNGVRLSTSSTGATTHGNLSVTGQLQGYTAVLTGALTIGSNGSGADAMFHSTTSGQYMEWDASMSLTRYRDNTKAA